MAAFPDRKDYPELSALLSLEGAHKFDLQTKKVLMEELDRRDIRVPPGFLIYWHINDGRKRPYCTFYNHLAGKGCSKEEHCNMVHRCLLCNADHGMWFKDPAGKPVCARLAKLQAEMERLGERALVVMDAWRCGHNLAKVNPEARKSPEREVEPEPKAPNSTGARLISRPSPIGRPKPAAKVEPVSISLPKPAAKVEPTPTPAAKVEPTPVPVAKVEPTPAPTIRPRPAPTPTAILPRPSPAPAMPILTLLPPPPAPARTQPQLMLVEVPTTAFLDFISSYKPEYVRTGSGAASVDSKTLISAISYV